MEYTSVMEAEDEIEDILGQVPAEYLEQATTIAEAPNLAMPILARPQAARKTGRGAHIVRTERLQRG